MSNTKPFEKLQAPQPQHIPHERTFHGDTFVDPFEWMRDKASQEVQDFVAQENAYTDARMAPLKNLRETLFDEFKSHVKETDMSVPTRVDGYWYYGRTFEGKQYGVQCRIPVTDSADWTPPHVGEEPLDGEQIVFDANEEAQGHDFFRIGGLDISNDGQWLLYGIDTKGDERYDFRIRNINTGEELPEHFDGVSSACFTPDAQYVFITELDDAWRPYAIRRHRVGTATSEDVEVFREQDERFWVGVGISFDDSLIVIGTGSKTTSEVRMLPVSNPEGEFETFIERKEGVEYDVSFAQFEGAGEHGEDIPIAVVYHNAHNPNFEVDIIDMRVKHPPYVLGDGECILAGSPYGCELGYIDMPIDKPYTNPSNPDIMQGARGLAIEGISIHRYYVAVAYRAEGLPHLAIMPKDRAAQDFLARRPWQLQELVPPSLDHDEEEAIAIPQCLQGFECQAQRLYSIGSTGNPSYEAPRLRYTFGSFTRPGELHEIDPKTGEDVLLKQAQVLGDFDVHNYVEYRVWVPSRDGVSIPVSLVSRIDVPMQSRAMFITGYGAYEISSDPGFSVARLSLLDRGVLYVAPHIRGGGEMGRAWYEQGRRLNKKHTFEDFIDVTQALQSCGLADPQRTVANGGSAGGLLMGAIANMAPQSYAGIEADVPFVDALTSILDPSLPLTVTEWDEWGDPLHDAKVYRYMRAYSPYENAPSIEKPLENKHFPKMFITTSMNDTRVLYVEPLKWTARMQEAGVDAMIKIEVEAGHGGTSGRYKQWQEVCYENAWCLHVMNATTRI